MKVTMKILFIYSASSLTVNGASDSFAQDSTATGLSSLATYMADHSYTQKDSTTNSTTTPQGALPKSDKKKPINPLPFSGVTNLRNHYGFIPYIYNSDIPAHFMEADGYLEFDLFKFPLRANYYYSNKPFLTGLQNYFTVSFDANQYKKRLQEDASRKVEKYKDSIRQLDKAVQTLEKKRLYYEYLLRVDSTRNIKKPNMPEFIPTEVPQATFPEGNTADFSVDSLDFPVINTPKLPAISPIDSALNAISSEGMRDSLDKIYHAIEKYQEVKRHYREGLNKYKHIHQGDFYPGATPRLKTLDIGLFYPAYSYFMINNVPVKGVNTEFETDRYYFAATAGITQNNFVVGLNSINNQLTNVVNPLNYFDFANNPGNKVASIKGGLGKKEESHIYLGMMYGKGRLSYFQSATHIPQYHNYVIELDARMKITDKQTLDVVMAASRLYEQASDISNSVSDELNKAALLIYGLKLPKLKSSLNYTTRLVQPNFRSLGLGFMRSDNFRHELRYNQQLGKKTKTSLIYRYEFDNLSGLLALRNSLQRLGGDLTYKPTRRINIRASYLPVHHKITDNDGKVIYYNNNYISNLILSWFPKIGKQNHEISAVYNDYHFVSDTVRISFQTVTGVNTLNFNKQWSNIINGTYIFDNSLDASESNVMLLKNEVQLRTLKNNRFFAGGKLARNYNTNTTQIGYKGGAQIQLGKKFMIELSAEKIIQGEFYQAQNIPVGKDFPFYAYSLIQYRW